jgi:hypothetical protein
MSPHLPLLGADLSAASLVEALIESLQIGKEKAQGLKPNSLSALCGPAKAVP